MGGGRVFERQVAGRTTVGRRGGNLEEAIVKSRSQGAFFPSLDSSSLLVFFTRCPFFDPPSLPPYKASSAYTPCSH